MATNYEELLPVEAVDQVVQALQEESAAIRLGNVITIPTGAATVPILSVAPQAAFVDPRYGGRKPATTIEWTAERLVAEEIACVVPIPDSFVDDSSYPVWESVIPALTAAVALVLDQAVFFGVNAPASYPTGGIAAAAQPPVGTAGDLPGSIDEAMGVVEESGLIPDGIASGTAIRKALRAVAREQMVPVGTDIVYTYYGLPVVTVTPWDSTAGDAIVGAYGTSLLIGLREDVTFETSSDGVLLDALWLPGPYAMRHAFATWMLDAGIELFEVARLMGTSVAMIDTTYGHLAHGHVDRVLERMNARPTIATEHESEAGDA